MKKIWVYLMVIFTFFSFDHAQQKVITGTVTSADDGSFLPGVKVTMKGNAKGTTTTDQYGKYKISVPSAGGTLVFSLAGFKSEEVKIGTKTIIDVKMAPVQPMPDMIVLEEATVGESRKEEKAYKRSGKDHTKPALSYGYAPSPHDTYHQPEPNTEDYAAIAEGTFQDAFKNPLSTFSIDVDKASYSNVRRFINMGQRPPKDAVRIEEMINYFDYDYKQPTDEHPFAVHTEVSEAPWNSKHKLVHIGLQGRIIPTNNLPASNLVFLIDVSGSMAQPNKLPLVIQSFKMLVDQLRQQDHVAIVVYAGAAGTVLEPTSGSDKKKIFSALDRLQAGGSTAGGEGLRLAYTLAKEHYKENGNNRVILATDGDFNVGESSNESMEKLITEKRKDGIFLTVLGYGMGNYKDSKMEILADKGNGNYAYIDNISEARKTLVSEFGGTLFTIAKDVKLQLEFNPAKVKAYRLIGYENRMLKSEDFNNDKKDAGELGSGHTVTALYEVIPVGVNSEFYSVDDLKYQPGNKPDIKYTDELLTVKLRYKKPDGDVSKLIVHTLTDRHVPMNKTSENFKWSASVAAFGMLLRESEFANNFTYDEVARIAQEAKGLDKEGYRSEFIMMVKSFGLVASR